MITHLRLRNVTVFKEADLKFSSGLNVIVGENGMGKTHLLKMCYLLSNAWANLGKEPNASKERMENYFSERIRNVFKPDKVGNLTTTDSDGKSVAEGWCFGLAPPFSSMIRDDVYWRLSFSSRSKEHIGLEHRIVQNMPAPHGKSIFLQAREMISIFEGFLALYEKREVSFDETYKDLALHLSTPPLKSEPEFFTAYISSLYDDVGGKLKLENGRFYLVTGSKRREISLVAEGIRKIATLLHLIDNGSLDCGDTLIWDEPESNLNPKLIKDVAAALCALAENGVQIILATHSYFLLKEIELINRATKASLKTTIFGLSRSDGGVGVEQGNWLQDLSTIVALDEELAQYDREQSLFYANEGE